MKTVSNGLGQVGGTDSQLPDRDRRGPVRRHGWKVKNNNIFGNFKWGVAAFSDPFNEGDDAISQNNQVTNNKLGRNGTDINGDRLLGRRLGARQLLRGQRLGDRRSLGDARPTPTSIRPVPRPGPPVSGTSSGDGEQQSVS